MASISADRFRLEGEVSQTCVWGFVVSSTAYLSFDGGGERYILRYSPISKSLTLHKVRNPGILLSRKLAFAAYLSLRKNGVGIMDEYPQPPTRHKTRRQRLTEALRRRFRRKRNHIRQTETPSPPQPPNHGRRS